MQDDSFWTDHAQASRVSQEASVLREKLAAFGRARDDLEGLQVHWQLLLDEGRSEVTPEYAEFEGELTAVVEEIERLEIEALLDGEFDNQPAVVTVHAGAGGVESFDWAEMLYRMYALWAPREGLELKVLDEKRGEVAGVQTITFRLTGRHAYGYLKTESGVHRLVRLSPFDASHRRHTSFAAVDVIPELPENNDLQIPDDEIRMEVFRSSGAGGQHVNKTSSAVRLIHIPTGIIATCQNERSQHQNREVALLQLKSKLVAIMRAEHKERVEDLRGVQTDIAWGNQIRSYVLHPYQLVKDLRTGCETSASQRVLDGELTPFIWAGLRWMRTQRDD